MLGTSAAESFGEGAEFAESLAKSEEGSQEVVEEKPQTEEDLIMEIVERHQTKFLEKMEQLKEDFLIDVREEIRKARANLL